MVDGSRCASLNNASVTFLPPAKSSVNPVPIVLAGLAVFVLLCGGLVTVFALAGSPTTSPSREQAAGTTPARGGAAPVVPTPSPSTPSVEVRTVTETQPVPFTETTVNDSSLA